MRLKRSAKKDRQNPFDEPFQYAGLREIGDAVLTILCLAPPFEAGSELDAEELDERRFAQKLTRVLMKYLRNGAEGAVLITLDSYHLWNYKPDASVATDDDFPFSGNV